MGTNQSKEEREFDLTGELSEDGESLVIHNARAIKRLWSGFGDKVLRIRFAILRQKRSDAQNRYIHGVMVPTAMAWHKETQGEALTHDEAYVWLRLRFLRHKPVIKEVMGEQVVTMQGKRFSKMNTKEFSEAVNFIVEEAAKIDLHFMLPRENNFISDFVDE